MKKVAVFLTISLLVQPLHATIDWKNVKDISFVAGAVAAGALGATIAGLYMHPAAAERARIEAEQENKRFQEQKEREARQKAETTEKERTHAHIELTKRLQEYAPEITALQNKGWSREKFITLIKSKQSSYQSRFKDYYESLVNSINYLHSISVLLSIEERVQLKNFTANLEELKSEFNLKLAEDIHAEQEEAKRIKRHEQAEQHRIERAELENKKLRGEIEAQKTVKDMYELVKEIKHASDLSRQEHNHAEKRTDLQLTAVARQLNLMMDTITEAIAAGNAQFANRLSALFAKEIEKATKMVKDALQNQAAPQVVVNQVPPAYNPAAVAAMNAAPSEAIDPAPTYK